MLFTQALSRCVKECVYLWRQEIPWWSDRRQSWNRPLILCQRCIICLQVLPAGERHPGGAQRHHHHVVQSNVWKDRGGESGEHQQGTVQYPGMRGYCGGRAGLHTLLY